MTLLGSSIFKGPAIDKALRNKFDELDTARKNQANPSTLARCPYTSYEFIEHAKLLYTLFTF